MYYLHLTCLLMWHVKMKMVYEYCREMFKYARTSLSSPPYLVHNGRLSTQAVIRETEAASLAAVIRLWLDKLLTVSFFLFLLFLPPLLLTVSPLFGTLGAELRHLRGTAWQVPSSIVLYCILWHCACRGCHGSSLPRNKHMNEVRTMA